MLDKKWQLTLIYFTPVFIFFSFFAWFSITYYDRSIDQIDDTIQDLAFNLDENIYINELENIISQKEWETLSMAQRDERLAENNLPPVGDQKDPLYFLTPAEITQKFLREPIFWDETTTNEPTLNTEALIEQTPHYISLEQIQEIQNDIQQKSILIILTILFIMTVIFAIIAYKLAKYAINPLERAIEKQRRFVSDSSHELRTPLTLMKTEAEILIKDKNASLNDYQKFAQNTITDVNRLSSLTDILLRLAKLDHGQESIKPTNLKPKNIIDSLIKKFSNELSKKNISCENQIPENIEIRADETILKHIFTIILDNAIKYGNENGKIRITADDQKKSCHIFIKDDGPGISKQDLPHIFDRFYRASKDRHAKGYGLGLAIAKELMSLLHGEITIISEPNKGTVVKTSFVSNCLKSHRQNI